MTDLTTFVVLLLIIEGARLAFDLYKWDKQSYYKTRQLRKVKKVDK